MIRKYHDHKPQTTRGTSRKAHSTITRHQKDELSKATSSLFPIKMIAILEWTKFDNLANVQQKILAKMYTQGRLGSSCTSSQSDQSLRWDSTGNKSTNVSSVRIVQIMSSNMGFPTMGHVRPANAQTSLHILTV